MRKILILALLLSGCAHVARHYEAPDSAPVEKANAKLAADVTASRSAVQKASESTQAARVAVSAAKTAHEAEGAQLAVLAPKVEELLRLAPVELRPLVEQLGGDVSSLQSAHGEVTAKIEYAESAVGKAQDDLAPAVTRLNEAEADKQTAQQRYTDYVAGVGPIVEKLNADEQAWHKDSAALAWYRLHWWGAWIVAGLGVAVCAFLAVLKFTGRLAISGAAIASRIP